MWRELLLCALVAPLLGTLAMRLLAERVAAHVAVVACTATAVLLALGTALVLFASGVHTTKTIVRAGKRGWTSDAWQDAVHDDLWVTGPCALGTLVLACSATRAWRRQRDARRAADDEAAALPGSDVVVVVPGQRPDAFTLPGSPGRIVVTEAMRAALSEDELRVVLAHERAHLAGRHHRYVEVAQLAAAGQPLLRPVARLVEYGVERWADEEAALVVGDRVRVARTIGTVALVTAAASSQGPQPAAPGSGTAPPPPAAQRTQVTAPPARPRPGRHRTRHAAAHSQHVCQVCGARPATIRRGPRPRRITAPDVPAVASSFLARLPWRPGGPRPGPVPRRVRALLRPMPGGLYLALLIIPVSVSLTSCLWAGNLVYDPHTPLHTALMLRQK
jgi:hypothetical protein